MQNVANTLCRYPAGPKFCRNSSISHRFQDECAFALYAEIQEGCQKWRESGFCEKVASRLCIYPVGQKFFLKIAHHAPFPRYVFLTFHAEIQDGRQKWRESDFCKKPPVHSGQPGAENFNKIALARLRR